MSHLLLQCCVQQMPSIIAALLLHSLLLHSLLLLPRLYSMLLLQLLWLLWLLWLHSALLRLLLWGA